MPTKTLPSTRAGVGLKRRRHNHSSHNGYIVIDGQRLQTRRPRFYAAPSGHRNHDRQQIRMINRDSDDASSQTGHSDCSSNSAASSDSRYLNLGRIGSTDSRSPIAKFDRERESLSDVSSGSEVFFQRQYRSLLNNRSSKQRQLAPRSPPPAKGQQKRTQQPEDRLTNRSMQLCNHHQRQISKKSASAAGKNGGDQSSFPVAYQAALSPLIASDSGDDRGTMRLEVRKNSYAKRLAKLAEQNVNTSNRQQYRQQQRQPETMSVRRSKRTNSPILSQAPPELSVSISASPSKLQAPSGHQQYQTMPQQFQSRRSKRRNQNYYTDWDCENNVSNQEDIYAFDQRRKASCRQTAQPQPRQPSTVRRQRQHQKMRDFQDKEPLAQPAAHKLDRRVDNIYSENHAESQLLLSGRRRSRQQYERSDLCYEVKDGSRFEPEDDEADLYQSNAEPVRTDNSERQLSRWSQQRERDRPPQLDRLTSIARPNHWCDSSSRLLPTQVYRETLYSCPYVTLSLHARTYECEECAATYDRRGGRIEKQRARHRLE